MGSNFCVIFNTEKNNVKFYNKHRECKQCNIQRSKKRYY